MGEVVQLPLLELPRGESEHVAPSTRRARKRRAVERQLIELGIHPATGARVREGEELCKDCLYAFLQPEVQGRYWKCRKVRVTRGAATDIKARWPACALFRAADPMKGKEKSRRAG